MAQGSVPLTRCIATAYHPYPAASSTVPCSKRWVIPAMKVMTMTGYDLMAAGGGGGYPPMPRHSAYALVYSIDCLIQSANRITPFNATQRVLCGAIQHPITASGTHPCDMSDAVSECLGIAVVRKVNNPNRIMGLGGNGKFSPAINPPGVGVVNK